MSARPLRVAHLVATTGRSGVERHLEALLPAFDPHEVAARLFVPGPGPLVDALAARGLACEPGAPTRKFAWGEARALGARLRGQVDVVHAHGPRVAFWARTVAHAAGARRVVATVHELRWASLPAGPRRWAWTALEAMANAGADALVTPSRAAHAALVARYPRWAPRTRVIAGSSPLLLDPPPPQRPERAPGPVRLVCVGRFHWVKGHDDLLAAVAHARAAGVALELTLIGDGPLASPLRERARALGVADAVRWQDGAFEPARTLPEHDLYVAASHTETFSIATLEALACGLPVLAPALGGFLDLVTPGVSGELVPGRERADWAAAFGDAIGRLAAQPDALRRMGEAAAREARTRLSPRTMAAATAALYREVVGV